MGITVSLKDFKEKIASQQKPQSLHDKKDRAMRAFNRITDVLAEEHCDMNISAELQPMTPGTYQTVIFVNIVPLDP